MAEGEEEVNIQEEANKGEENPQEEANIQEETNKGEENIQEEANIEEEANKEEESLKYLDFVQAATVYARASFSKLYLFAKDKSGPFKPGVNTVESRFKSVVRPVYNKFQPVPNKVLKFADRRVDAYVTVLDRIVPPIVKRASIQAYSVAPGAALAVASYLPLHTKRLSKVLYGDG
uniref:Rubber elongation factor n=1 Tax=Hevea brasiliensis TaxID=3981 RepID=Q6T708_HEVBR|nr:rubber elongation factor [Hevea brasiliensis]